MNTIPADKINTDFDPFAGPEIISFVPSTESQLEIWMSCKLGGDDANRAFNESISLKFKGSFAREAFEKSINALVARHESLRSAFSPDGSKMFIFKEALFNYSFRDISNLGKKEVDNEIKTYILNDSLFTFNLSDGPLSKFGLFKLSENEYHLTITAHHIICDGWSMGIILQDLSRFYTAFSQNTDPRLPEPDSFSKYALQQADFVKSPEYKNNIDYWVSQFETVPVLNLPIDHARQTPKSFRSSRYDYILDNDLVSSIKNTGIKQGCSFVNTLLAAFEIFIYKITGEDEIVVGLPAADQSATGLYNLVGHCVNLLPLKSKPDGKQSFSEFLKLRKSAILDAYEHQQFTFGSLLKNLRIKRDPSRVPLVPVVFNVDMEMDKDVSFNGLTYEIFSNSKEFRNFELSLNIWGSEKQIQLEWSYNSDLFERDSIVGMMKEFENLLRGFVSNPSGKIEDIISVKGIDIAKETVVVHVESDAKNYQEADKAFWLNMFNGELPVLELATDRLRPQVRTYKAAIVDKSFEQDITKEWRKLMESLGCDRETGFLSLVNILLYRYTGQEDIIVGRITPLSSGLQSETSALRTLFDGEDNIGELLKKTGVVSAQALNHKSYNLDRLLKDMNLADNKHRHPLFDVEIMVVDGDPIPREALSEIDLRFVFSDETEKLDMRIIYNGELFDEETVCRMAGHIEGLMRAIVEGPSETINELDYLGYREKNNLVYELNNTADGYPRTKATIVSLFEDQVNKTPDNIALVFEGHKLTYRTLNEKANRFGNYLRKTYGLKGDDLIGVKLERSEWLIIAIMGVLKSGGAYVPMDPDYPEERITYILEDSQCKIVIDYSVLSDFLKVENNFSKKNPVNIINSRNLLYLIYTSGSTGKPKAVMIDHRNMINYILWFINKFEISDREGTLLLSSITFDGVKTSVFGALLSGSALHVMGKDILQSPKELSAYIRSKGITFLKITPPLLNLLVSDNESFIAFNEADKLRLIIVGGEKLNINDIKKIKLYNQRIRVVNHYGPTETTVGVTTQEIIDVDSPVCIGKPISNAQIFILDARQKLLPKGVFGEICIGGEGLSRGYLNKPELSSEKFVDNPLRNGKKMYRTGDIGRWTNEGSVEFVGRKDHQVKIRGYRIELGEIESAILEHPKIESTVVLASEESNGENTLIAFIIAAEQVTGRDMRTYLENKLPFYMVPSFFVQIDEIPLTINGKIDRAELLKIQSKQPEKTDVRNLQNTPEENLIAGIWSDLLGIKNISKTDDFFELGGHSLIAIKVIIRLENETGFKLPMASLFEYPTIEKIAKLITHKEKLNKWKTLVPIRPAGVKTPLYIAHGGGLGVLVFQHIAKYLDADQPVFGLQALGLDGNDEPLETIEEMASYYISEMLEQNPEGPYSLAGHSSGGLIAFEIAQQLKTMGKEVKSLVIFDFDLGEIQKFHSLNEKLRRKIINFFPILFFNIRSMIRRPHKTFNYYKLIWKLRYESIRERLGLNEVIVHEGLDYFIHNAMIKNERAIWNYKLKEYHGTMDLLVSIEKVYFQEDARYLGWRPYIMEGIKTHDVNGDHDEMIMPPNNQQFARKLQDILDSN